MTEPANPFDHSSNLNEPPVGTVIAWQKRAPDGTVLDYVSFRAGNNRWYTTGVRESSFRSWDAMLTQLRMYSDESAQYATAWAKFSVGVERPRYSFGNDDDDA